MPASVPVISLKVLLLILKCIYWVVPSIAKGKIRLIVTVSSKGFLMLTPQLIKITENKISEE